MIKKTSVITKASTVFLTTITVDKQPTLAELFNILRHLRPKQQDLPKKAEISWFNPIETIRRNNKFKTFMKY